MAPETFPAVTNKDKDVTWQYRLNKGNFKFPVTMSSAPLSPLYLVCLFTGHAGVVA